MLSDVVEAEQCSVGAVDGNSQSGTHLTHPRVAEPAQPVDQYGERHALHRVEVDRRATRNRVVTRLEDDFALEPTNGCGAWCDQRSSMSREHGVTREHNDRPTADLDQLAPPDLPSAGKAAQDAAAARRKDARSPHSSGSSSGCSS